MPVCKLRPATPEDTPAVYHLISELKQVQYPRDAFATGFAANLLNPTLHYQVAEFDGEVVGLIGMQLQFQLHHSHWIGEIQELVVLPKQRGLNIGQRLLHWAEAEARAHGAEGMELSSGKGRTEAHRFYLREGYLQSHYRFKKTLQEG
ncbi:MAG: aminoalkylphosphonate N-acetyltransferase [Yokenella regensburgei]|jgi:PhnO protein|nr:aminoalkylphosphonate N-acetyltransferase [Yokenella regensburgei]